VWAYFKTNFRILVVLFYFVLMTNTILQNMYNKDIINHIKSTFITHKFLYNFNDYRVRAILFLFLVYENENV
jgi:hypothetical protein